MKTIRSVSYVVILFFMLVASFLVQGAPVSDTVVEPVFNPDSVQKTVRSIVRKHPIDSSSVKQLAGVMDKLDTLSSQAQECVDKTGKEIAGISGQMKAIFGKDQNDELRVDSQYLSKQKQQLVDRQAKCRLVVLQVDKLVEQYKSQILGLQQKITFTKGLQLGERIKAIQKDMFVLSIPKMAASTYFSHVYIVSFILALIACCFILAIRFWGRSQLRRRAIGITQGVLFFIALWLLMVWISNYQPFVDVMDNRLYLTTVFELFFLVTGILLIHFIFAMRRVLLSLDWYGFDTSFLCAISQVILILYSASYIGIAVLTIFDAGQALKQFYDSVVMFLSLMATLYFSYQFYVKHQKFFSIRYNAVFLFRMILLVVFTLFVLDLIGYYVLAVDASHVFFSIMLVSGLSLVLLRGFSRAYQYLNYAPNAQRFLAHYFGYQGTPPYFELVLLKWLVQVTVVVSLIYLFAYLIGEASYFIDNVLDYLFNGFVFTGYMIQPMHWLSGILLFCLIVLLFRYVSRRLSLQAQLDGEEEMQVALASILLYIGFAIAIIMGLLVAGFSFTSLTIIAGALSVGIGLGLQSIVNNFFSGLILLIEKPIKAGDRISIGNVEGFVKKVRVRSTQLETPAREDIIIPNSDFMTEQVTNFMFENKLWRVKCTVGVAYGSDTELVRQVLLEVARNHGDVVDSRRNKPMVLFREFSDSALTFELWCMIRDVNKKYLIASDLNFAIDKAFREHDIVIAFPQQDVHLKIDSLTNKKDDESG
jgi:small-conductance mechanosensitive channel